MSAEAARPQAPGSTSENSDNSLETCRQLLRKKIHYGDLDLPLLPQVAGEVMAMSHDPEADIGKLSSLIHQDQALAGHVLRISNSAAYGSGERIVSLQQAVTRLGMKLLGEITFTVSLKGEVFEVPEFAKDIKQIWRHALASGAYSKEAARMKRTNVEALYLCGLLHTIGKPVLLKTLTDMQSKVDPALTREEVLQLVDDLHGEVGQTLIEKWNLPTQVGVVCAHYRQYDEAPSHQDETAMTYLVDALAQWLTAPEVVGSAGDEQSLIEDPVLDRLNIYPDEVQELLEKKDDVLAVVNAMDL